MARRKFTQKYIIIHCCLASETKGGQNEEGVCNVGTFEVT